MNRPDHMQYEEWLHLEADGCLRPSEKALLDDHLAACAACRREREQLAALARLLRIEAVPVQREFKERVLAALPAAGWESRSPRSWWLPAALLVFLSGLSAVLLHRAAAPLGSSTSALLAVLEMFEAAALAGAGLLAASWKGLGMLVAQGLSGSPLSFIAFGIFVVSLNILLISLLRRRSPRAERAERYGGRR